MRKTFFHANLQKHKIMFYETFEHFLFAFSIWLKMTGFLTFEKFFEQIFATYFLVNRKCWTLSLKLAVKANWSYVLFTLMTTVRTGLQVERLATSIGFQGMWWGWVVWVVVLHNKGRRFEFRQPLREPILFLF